MAAPMRGFVYLLLVAILINTSSCNEDTLQKVIDSVEKYIRYRMLKQKDTDLSNIFSLRVVEGKLKRKVQAII